MKRFYQTAAARAVPGGYGVTLDGKSLKTPAKRPLVLPGAALAAAVAAEWQAQGETIEPDRMPLMKLVSTALDRVQDQMPAVVAELVRYAGTDLLCYRATEPAALVAREQAVWQPLLDWAMVRLDAPLVVTQGVMAVEQPAASLRALGAVVAGLDVFALTALADLTAACGSLVLALAVWDGWIDAATAFEAAELDQSYEIEQWGEDGEATQRRARLKADIEAAARLLALLRAGEEAAV